MRTKLNIRLAARCEAAGRKENEDNFQVAEDLSVSNVGFTTDKTFSLGSKGTLLLVCDGMGGMNAGEVASAIAVKTIKNLFEPTLLTSAVLQNDDTVCDYIRQAIIKADADIKDEAAQDSAKQGMGSTAVLAWMLGSKVYVGWCGDSRAYRYNPNFGLEQLSHDHSYVQDLVDTGKLDPDLAFDHPQKNIITRSLGDPRGAARPDVKAFDLRLGDTILLCSDGLSDSLRDEEIAVSMKKAGASMAACLETLWEDSRKAGWCDNVTVILGHVVNENEERTSKPVQKPVSNFSLANNNASLHSKGNNPNSYKKYIIGVCVIILLAVVAVSAYNKVKENKEKEAKIEKLCGEIPDNLSFNKNASEEALTKEIREYIKKCNDLTLLDPETGAKKAKVLTEAVKNVVIEMYDESNDDKYRKAENIRKLISQINQAKQ